MSKQDAWFPLYVADYLGDTQHLTCTEHGAYLLLLMHQWRHGAVPLDHGRLAQIVKLRIDLWRKIEATVMAFFEPTEDRASLRQSRLHAERIRTDKIGAKRADAAHERWRNVANAPGQDGSTEPSRKPLKKRGVADANASDLHGVCMAQLQPQYPSSLRSAAAQAAAQQGMPPVRQDAKAEHVALNDTVPRDLLGDAPRPSARQALFCEGLQKLIAMTGRNGGRLRAWLGKALRETDDDAGLILSLVQDAHRRWLAQDQELSDPVSWIAAAVKQRVEAMRNGRLVQFPDRAKPGEAAPKPGSAAWAARRRAEALARAMAAQGGAPIPAAAGPTIDGKAECVG